MKLDRSGLGMLLLLPLLNVPLASVSASVGTVEISKTEAISRIRYILNRHAAPCRITQIETISAAKGKAGWRVNARIRLAGRFENAVWIVSRANGSTPQNQLTAEIENGCA